MRVSKYLLLLAFVGGCSTAPTFPPTETIRYVPQEVKIPVPIKCQTPIPEKPDFSFPKIKEDSDIFEKVKSLLADRNLHLGYEDQLLTALQSCK